MDSTDFLLLIMYICVFSLLPPHYVGTIWFCTEYILGVTKSWMSWAEHPIQIEEMRNKYRILIGKTQGKRSRGKPSCRWKDSIKNEY
jgi:hypothetical protein